MPSSFRLNSSDRQQSFNINSSSSLERLQKPKRPSKKSKSSVTNKRKSDYIQSSQSRIYPRIVDYADEQELLSGYCETTMTPQDSHTQQIEILNECSSPEKDLQPQLSNQKPKYRFQMPSPAPKQAPSSESDVEMVISISDNQPEQLSSFVVQKATITSYDSQTRELNGGLHHYGSSFARNTKANEPAP